MGKASPFVLQKATRSPGQSRNRAAALRLDASSSPVVRLRPEGSVTAMRLSPAATTILSRISRSITGSADRSVPVAARGANGSSPG